MLSLLAPIRLQRQESPWNPLTDACRLLAAQGLLGHRPTASGVSCAISGQITSGSSVLTSVQWGHDDNIYFMEETPRRRLSPGGPLEAFPPGLEDQARFAPPGKASGVSVFSGRLHHGALAWIQLCLLYRAGGGVEGIPRILDPVSLRNRSFRSVQSAGTLHCLSQGPSPKRPLASAQP